MLASSHRITDLVSFWMELFRFGGISLSLFPFLSATTTKSSTMSLKDHHVFINHNTPSCPHQSYSHPKYTQNACTLNKDLIIIHPSFLMG